MNRFSVYFSVNKLPVDHLKVYGLQTHRPGRGAVIPRCVSSPTAGTAAPALVSHSGGQNGNWKL
ncbi:hypothetical protein J6590_065629 [Homalodisca vitripennis]|nr:hypothetical protein J6590_065629 [Homalodisca vitripennis]